MAILAPAPKPEALDKIVAEFGLSTIPRHVAVIMDGNGRWANRRGMPRLAGHAAGRENVRRITTACADVGVEVLTIYAFSTENWRRPADEVLPVRRERGACETVAQPQLVAERVDARRHLWVGLQPDAFLRHA